MRPVLVMICDRSNRTYLSGTKTQLRDTSPMLAAGFNTRSFVDVSTKHVPISLQARVPACTVPSVSVPYVRARTRVLDHRADFEHPFHSKNRQFKTQRPVEY